MSLPHLLRRRLEEHNRQVFGYTLLTAAGALALWTALYGLAWWLSLCFLSAAVGPDARPLPHFTRYFFETAAGSLLLAWFWRALQADERPRDHRSGGEIALDFLLVAPRVTLAVWGNLSAWQKLTPPETESALHLLERLQAGRLPVRALPQEIPDETTRARLLYTLQLIGLIETRREDDGFWLKLATPPPPPESRQTRDAKRKLWPTNLPNRNEWEG